MIQVLSIEENENFITTTYTVDGVHASHVVTEHKDTPVEEVTP
jgi:hypothetical protein